MSVIYSMVFWLKITFCDALVELIFNLGKLDIRRNQREGSRKAAQALLLLFLKAIYLKPGFGTFFIKSAESQEIPILSTI